MCSTAGDIEDFSDCSTPFKISLKKELLFKCKKCSENSILVLQRKDPFCKSCFFEYCNHKFRSTIGKSKKIKHGEMVLLACSGGRKSSALLNMTVQTLKSASMKQISFTPAILFIDDMFLMDSNCVDAKTDALLVIKELQSANYPVFYSSLDMVNKINSHEDLFVLVSENCSTGYLNGDIGARIQMKESFKDIPLSSKIDLLKHLRLLLITEIASQAGFNHVFLGDTASSLAVELLSDIALGRGSQISSDTSFCDSRHQVSLCRPLREFLDKELAFYNHFYGIKYHVLPDFLTKASSKSCIQRLTETFLLSLQENFPATVFTVFRTGGKLSKSSACLESKICKLCKSELDNSEPDPCSALEALKISHQLSSSKKDKEEESLNILQLLCHGCSVIFERMASAENFSYLFPKTSLTRRTQNDMKDEIKDFLIDENR